MNILSLIIKDGRTLRIAGGVQGAGSYKIPGLLLPDLLWFINLTNPELKSQDSKSTLYDYWSRRGRTLRIAGGFYEVANFMEDVDFKERQK